MTWGNFLDEMPNEIKIFNFPSTYTNPGYRWVVVAGSGMIYCSEPAEAETTAALAYAAGATWIENNLS
jgi:hypothetical protein